MRLLKQLLDRIRKVDDGLQAEMEAHLAERVDELIAGGLLAPEARLQARREFGNMTLTAERSREVWRCALLDDFLQDLRYASRALRRSVGFTVTAITCLALGIGATTAVFSIVYGVLLRPLPYHEPERLVAVWNSLPHDKGSKLFAPYRDFENWRDHSRSFSELAGVTWATGGRILTGRGAVQKVQAIPTTVNLFSLLGVAPALGRTFQQEDLSRGCTVVLAHRFWQGAMSGQRNIVGQQLRLDEESCTVIGVMPAGFTFYPQATELWTLITPNSELPRTPDRSGLGVFGRLKPGISIAAAQAELQSLALHINGGTRYGAQMEPVIYPLQEEFTWLAGRNLRLSLLLLFAAVTAVLLIACVNVATLILGRSSVRQRELTIRAALGSGRGRLLRQLFTESLLLAILAAIAGAVVAVGAVQCFRLVNPIELPPGSVIAVSFPVLAFTTGLAGLTAVLCGLVPAWRTSDVALHDAVKSGSRTSLGSGKHRSARALVAVEVTLSLVLLVWAGLLIESVVRFTAAPLGFQAKGLVRLPVTLLPNEYSQPEARVAFYQQLRDDASAVPAVQHAALSTAIPLRGGRGSNILLVEGRPDPSPQTARHDIAQQAVSPRYFECMSIPLRQGRALDARDARSSRPVAVINDELSRTYFPAEDPIGKHIRIFGESEWLTIVGVAADEQRATVYQEMGWVRAPIVYRPLAQQAPAMVDLLIRTASDDVGRSLMVQQHLSKLHPRVFLGPPEPVERLVAEYLKYPRFRGVTSGVFAALALVLAVVGIYGVLSQWVAQRTREIGLRMALGAQRRTVLSMVVRQGLLLVAAGLAAGLVLTALLTRLLAGLLYGVGPLDPAILLAVSAVLLSVSLLAAYLPAYRAAAVDPMIALREE